MGKTDTFKSEPSTRTNYLRENIKYYQITTEYYAVSVELFVCSSKLFTLLIIFTLILFGTKKVSSAKEAIILLLFFLDILAKNIYEEQTYYILKFKFSLLNNLPK